MFNKKNLLRGNNRPLVDLSYWAKNTYPDTYQTMTQIPQQGMDYLKSVRPTSMQSAFESCFNLTSLDLTGIDFSHVTNMHYFLSGWNTPMNITSLNVSGLNVSKVTNMSCAFRSLTMLASIDLTSWHPASKVNLNATFFNMKSLTSLDLSSFNCEATSLYYAFRDMSNLKVLDISNITYTAKSTDSIAPGTNALEYLILNSKEIKLRFKSTTYNLTNNCKILVPRESLSKYTSETLDDGSTNYLSQRADQFDAIENYTITRSNGQVTVTPK